MRYTSTRALDDDPRLASGPAVITLDAAALVEGDACSLRCILAATLSPSSCSPPPSPPCQSARLDYRSRDMPPLPYDVVDPMRPRSPLAEEALVPASGTAREGFSAFEAALNPALLLPTAPVPLIRFSHLLSSDAGSSTGACPNTCFSSKEGAVWTRYRVG